MVKVKRTIKDYEDIIHLPHHVSKSESKCLQQTEQLSSHLSAVVGHEAAVKETARYTDKRKELDETEKNIINEKLQEIYSSLPEEYKVTIVYFEPDILKKGGQYLSINGTIKKIDTYNQIVLFNDGTKIKFEDIYSIEL